ncbi:MAG: DUF6531 domain-containing protein [Burkholderiaceae bacterium]
MIGLKNVARLALLVLGMFIFGATTAHACIYQGSTTPCPADCKEDGGEVQCVAPIPVPSTAGALTDRAKWQYRNAWFPGRDEDPFYFCLANGGTIVADNVPNSCHGLPSGYTPGGYGKSYYSEGLVNTAASNFANWLYSACPPTGSSDTGWGVSNINNSFEYYASGVRDYKISGILTKSYRRMVFTGARNKKPDGTCDTVPIDITVDAAKTRSVACPAGTTWRELTSTFDANRIVRCAPDVITDLNCKAGNPVSPGSGAKLETSVDYQGAGAHPLLFERQYNSRALSTVDHPFSAAAPWSHNYARTLRSYEVPNASGSTMAQLMLASSSMDQRLLYRLQASNTWLADTPGNRNTLTELKDASGNRTGWQHKLWADDTVETYDVDGMLLSIKQRNGWITTLTYSTAATPVTTYLIGSTTPTPGLLVGVKNHFGRELKFTYEIATSGGLPQPRLKELLPPGAVSGSGAGLAQSPIVYNYEEAANLGTSITKQGQLTSVTWQDGTTRRYHYEGNSSIRSHHLTGITDESGIRIGTYTYLDGYYVGWHNDGKVGSTQKAGGAEKLEFSYSPGGTGRGTGSTTITDYSGPNGSATTRTYTIENSSGVTRPTKVTAPCPLCGTTQQSTVYGDGTTANGGAGAKGQPIKTVAHDGTVTFYTYDTKGRETEKATFPASYAANATRPALNLATQVISTQWHATWNLPTKIAEPGKITAFTYANANATTGMGAGNLTGRSETQTTDATGAAKFTAAQAAGTPIKSTGWSYNTTSSLPTTIVERETAFGATTAVEKWRATYTYNAVGDVTQTKTTKATINTTTKLNTYDSKGRLTTGVDANGVSFGYEFDKKNRLIAYTYGTSGRVTVPYSADGLQSGTDSVSGISNASPVNSILPFSSFKAAGAAAEFQTAQSTGSNPSGDVKKEKCDDPDKCLVFCNGAPGYPVVICTRTECRKGTCAPINTGLYSWLSRPFNFIGKFDCKEFDRLLRENECLQGSCSTKF